MIYKIHAISPLLTAEAQHLGVSILEIDYVLADTYIEFHRVITILNESQRTMVC